MSDSVFTNDFFGTATDLGTLGFTGSDFDGFFKSQLFQFDSVGAPPDTLTTGSFSSDISDFFTFDTFDLATLRVNFNADTVGDFDNLVFFIPVAGVSAVTGALIGSWSSSGDDGFFAGSNGAPVLSLFDPAGVIPVPPALNLSAATFSANSFTGAEAVWTLTGAPVVVQVLGIHFEIENLGGPDELEVEQDVDYRFTINPQTGLVPIPDPVPQPDPDPVPDPLPDPLPDPVPDPIGQTFVNVVTVSQTLTGGAGIDFFEGRGYWDAFTYDVLSDGRIILTETLRPERVDTLINIERIDLIDGFLAFDFDGNAGQAYRLYEAAFNRDPDAEGLGFWIDNYDVGNVDLVQMAEFFMQSEEFTRLYGAEETLSDQSFLTLLYANVLDRTPDQAGFDFWSDAQANGVTRPEILQYFSESTENYANVAGEIADGIWYV